MNYEMKELGKVVKLAFAVAVLASLALSLWSIVALLTSYGTPLAIAVSTGFVFDLAALITAKIAANYAESPYSPMGPKMWTNVFASGSIFLNAVHGMQVAIGAAVAWALPSFIALILFHLYLGYTNKKGMASAGRYATPLPIVGWFAIMLYPKEAFTNIRKAVGVRMRTSVARFENQQNATLTANAIAKHTVKPVVQLEKVVAEDVNAIENYANENAKPAIHNATDANAMKAIDANRDVRTAKVANLNANASVNAIVAKGYEEGLRTVDELVPFVNEIKPGTEKVKVSKALSYTKKKYNLEGTGFYA